VRGTVRVSGRRIDAGASTPHERTPVVAIQPIE